MGPPPACCDSNSRTVKPTADSWPLAASACCRQAWAAPKRYCKASPFPPAVPTPCCCYRCTGPFDLRASKSFTRVRSWSLSVSAAFAASRARWASSSFPLSCKTSPSGRTARCCHWG